MDIPRSNHCEIELEHNLRIATIFGEWGSSKHPSVTAILNFWEKVQGLLTRVWTDYNYFYITLIYKFSRICPDLTFSFFFHHNLSKRLKISQSYNTSHSQ